MTCDSCESGHLIKELTLAYRFKRRKLTPESRSRSITVMSFTVFQKVFRRRGFVGLQPSKMWFISGLLVCLMMLFAGCGGKPFNVKPQVDLPLTPDAARAEASSVQIQAAAIRDEDLLIGTFDANLLLAGILPVKVALNNQSHESIDLRKARFELRGTDGRTVKASDAKRVFKRLISYYEITTYSKPGYKESREDFAGYGIDLSKPLNAGESRTGMVFFIVPDRAAQTGSLALVVSRLDAKQAKAPAVELKLQ